MAADRQAADGKKGQKRARSWVFNLANDWIETKNLAP